MIKRPWAFWRRVWYGGGFVGFWVLMVTILFFIYGSTPPTCFDGLQNGDERGVDCGGSCVRICASDITRPTIDWAKSFEIVSGQYNAVAYVTNPNPIAATPKIPYTLSLYDDTGLITERTGTTVLPPNSQYPIFEGRIQTGNRIPTHTRLVLGEADVWLPATAGREQFSLVERKFFDTNTGRPRLEAVMRNNALTEAKEVEFVVTIFDREGEPLTASQTFVDNFAAGAEERIVFTWPNPIATTLRSCEIPTDVVVAIDLSGSMNNDQPDPPEPLTSVLAAAESFVNRLETDDQVGVVTFATEAELTRPLSREISSAARAINSLSIDPKEETGSTNTGDALKLAAAELMSERGNNNARKVLVILTDGLATAPDPDPELYARTEAGRVKQQDITVYSIGLGESVNMDFIRSIASSPRQAYQALTTDQVDAIYKTITASLCENGPATMDIIPKTDDNFVPLQ